MPHCAPRLELLHSVRLRMMSARFMRASLVRLTIIHVDLESGSSQNSHLSQIGIDARRIAIGIGALFYLGPLSLTDDVARCVGPRSRHGS